MAPALSGTPRVGSFPGGPGAVLVGRDLAYWGDVSLQALLDALITGLDPATPLPHAPFPGLAEPQVIPDPSHYPAADRTTYDSFKSLLNAQYLAGLD